MRTEAKQSWWRQLGAISQGMLFLDGHIASVQAAEAASQTRGFRADAGDRRNDAQTRPAAAARQAEYAKQVRRMTALSLFR